MKNCEFLDNLVREDLKGMEPYDAYYAPGIVRLDANENPHDFPLEVSRYMASRMGPQFFGRYPDPLARDLVADLAENFSVKSKNIMVGNGSDELILNLMLAFGSGKKVYIAAPTFSMYAIHARVAGAIPVYVPRGPGFAIDVQAMLDAAGKDPGLVVLCNPNNPTGNAAPRSDIEAIAKALENSLVVVDEAYIEFGGETCVPVLEQYPNLLVMRTFSKAFGLAGMRVGYLLANSDVVKEMMRIKQPFNVNSFSQLAACAVLRHRDLFKKRIKTIINDREKLIKSMSAMSGLQLYPSVTNFLCFKTEVPAQQVYRDLLAAGIMIRYLKTAEGEELLRVSVGTDRENGMFIDRLRSILDN